MKIKDSVVLVTGANRPDQIARRTLAALEAGQEEVLADQLSRELKWGLSRPHAAYLGEAQATVA